MRRSLPAALVAGAVCAMAVPLTEPGLGWPIAGLAVLVAVLVAGPRRGWHVGRIAAGAGALLLLAAGALRAAGWLFVLCLAAAVPLASLAVAGTGRTWRRAARGAVAVLFAVPGAGEFRGCARGRGPVGYRTGRVPGDRGTGTPGGRRRGRR